MIYVIAPSIWVLIDLPLRASNEIWFIWSISSIWFVWLVEPNIHPEEPDRPANQTDKPVRVARARGVIRPSHHQKVPFREALERRALPPLPPVRLLGPGLQYDGGLLFLARLLVVGLLVSLGEFEEHDFLALVVDVVQLSLLPLPPLPRRHRLRIGPYTFPGLSCCLF